MSAVEKMCDIQRNITDIVTNEKSERYFVPWQGGDVILIFVVAYLLIFFCTSASVQLFVLQTDEQKKKPNISSFDKKIDRGTAKGSEDSKKTTMHPLTQLIRQGHEKPIILLVAFLSGVVLAPLAEEFLFRLVLQGWLTKTVDNYYDIPQRSVLSGILPIIIVSLFFASMHSGERTEQSVEILFAGLLGLVIACFLIFTLGISYLVLVRQATPKDIGFDSGKIFLDLTLAGLAFIITTPLVLTLNYCLQKLFPESVVDPIPLFFLALVLGALFYKTRRIQSSIILHALFNGLSFFVLVFAPIE